MPKPFRFKLQKVLDFRARREDEAKAVLAKARADHDRQSDAVAGIERTLGEHVRKGFGDKAEAGEVWLWRQYREGLEKDLARGREELARLALILQKCRNDAIKRSRDRKLLDKLKEHQAEKHRDEENRREQKETDEMAAIRHQHEDF